MSEVRGDGQECQAATAQAQPRGATPCPRSGAEAESARLRWRRNVLEELPPSEVRDGGWEDQPHVQGAVAAWVPEGLEELFHIQGREGHQ